MLEYAKWIVYAYGFYDKSSLTRIETWDRMAEDGIIHEDAEEKPEIPKKLIYLWNIYQNIRIGCKRVTYEVINSYQNITGITLTLWEIDIMIRMELLRPLET